MIQEWEAEHGRKHPYFPSGSRLIGPQGHLVLTRAELDRGWEMWQGFRRDEGHTFPEDAPNLPEGTVVKAIDPTARGARGSTDPAPPPPPDYCREEFVDKRSKAQGARARSTSRYNKSKLRRPLRAQSGEPDTASIPDTLFGGRRPDPSDVPQPVGLTPGEIATAPWRTSKETDPGERYVSA